MNKTGTYLIRNSINNKVYIGSAVNKNPNYGKQTWNSKLKGARQELVCLLFNRTTLKDTNVV